MKISNYLAKLYGLSVFIEISAPNVLCLVALFYFSFVTLILIHGASTFVLATGVQKSAEINF